MERINILIVGAGGIGCELLKTCILTGAKKLTIIDLDSIDKSNLNRQFLFTKADIGNSKALTAASVIKRLRPEVEITGLCENIFSKNPGFFEQFDLIYNALDNLAARRYVNRICVMTKKVFIDAGTKGKTGQVTVHKPSVSKCYDCEEKATPKQYAVCTIRSTPSTIEHCIAWGKYLYETLFAPEDSSNILSDLKLAQFSNSKDLFFSLFVNGFDEHKALKYPETINPLPCNKNIELSFDQLAGLFEFSFEILKTREVRAFDKNDETAVYFISAVSNLRALNFGINGRKSVSGVQQIAGNIIPAIGSTNAIVAGLQVIEGFKVVNGEHNYGSVWVNQTASNKKYIVPCSSESPNPQCFICSNGVCSEEIDIEKTDLKDFVDTVLINKHNFMEPSLYINDNLVYESGDIEEDFIEIYRKNSAKTLKELDFESGRILVIDNLQNCKIFLKVTHKAEELPVKRTREDLEDSL